MKITSDTHSTLKALIMERMPWLIIGLAVGMLASYFVSGFEEILKSKITLAFFIPIIVYMSDAVGTQTETIFVRDLTEHRANFHKYLIKEMKIGLVIGFILGLLTFICAFLWLKDVQVATTVSVAMFINVLIAPVIATIIPEILFKEHKDPALGAGPFTTVIQDTISLLIYFLTASLIILR